MPKYDIRSEKYPNVCYCIKVLGTRTLITLYPTNDPQHSFSFPSFKAIVRSPSWVHGQRGAALQWQKENHVGSDNFSSTGRMANLCFSLSRAKTRSEIVSNSRSSSDLPGVDRVCQSLERVAKSNSRHRGKQISPPTRPLAWRTSGETGGEKEKGRVSSSKCTKVRLMWLPFTECSENSPEHQFTCRRMKDLPLKGEK